MFIFGVLISTNSLDLSLQDFNLEMLLNESFISLT